jgi:hypothetical protein
MISSALSARPPAMIPDKKKTPVEIAALREGLGVPPAPPAVPHAPAAPPAQPEEPLPTSAPAAEVEPVIHLDLPSLTARPVKAETKPAHSLRKRELPLAPAPAVTHKTALPTHRHDPRDVAQIRKREALAALQHQQGADPAAHLRKQTASPFLYAPGYLFASAAAITSYLRVHYITPAGLLGLAIVIMLFIALRKPRSRHHAALLFIVVFLTLVFGALHYAPLFQNVP